MASSDDSLNAPKPEKRRNVSGFSTKPPAARTARAPAKTPKPKRAKTNAAKRGGSQVVRVHASVSVEVATALRKHAASAQRTQTEILAEAAVTHGPTLQAAVDSTTESQYEELGFRRRRPRPGKGRMTVTFYMPERARASLDDMAHRAGFDSRSALIDALLRHQLGIT